MSRRDSTEKKGKREGSEQTEEEETARRARPELKSEIVRRQ